MHQHTACTTNPRPCRFPAGAIELSLREVISRRLKQKPTTTLLAVAKYLFYGDPVLQHNGEPSNSTQVYRTSKNRKQQWERGKGPLSRYTQKKHEYRRPSRTSDHTTPTRTQHPTIRETTEHFFVVHAKDVPSMDDMYPSMQHLAC